MNTEPATESASDSLRAAAARAAHREDYNRRHRERYQNRIPKIDAKEGDLFRNDPKREERLRIRGYVVCRVCLGKFKQLIGGASHLRVMHSMTRAQYLTKWPGAPLICLAQKTALSKRSRRMWESERAGPGRGRKVRGHDEGSAPRWPMICLRVQGYSEDQIGAEMNRTCVAVHRALAAVALSGEPAVYDFGEAWTPSSFRQLKTATGLTATELEQQIDAPHRHLVEATRPGRALNNRGAVRRIRPALARKGIAWRDKTLGKLLIKVQASRSPDAIDKSRILKTFFPNLRSSYKLLCAALRKMREYLQENSAAGARELQDYLYTQARLEVAKRPTGNLVAKFLPWAPALMPFLEANLPGLRGPGALAPIAHKAIGDRWNVAPSIVSEAIRSRTHRIPPREMRHLLLGRVPDGARRSTPRKSLDQRSKYKLAKAVQAVLAKFAEGLKVRRAAQVSWPIEPRRWESALRQEGFTVQADINAIISSKTAAAAAAKSVAQRNDLTARTVQNAYSSYRKLLS